MKIIVVSGRDGARKEDVQLPDGATLADLKAAYRPKTSDHRKAFKIPGPEKPAAEQKPEEPGKKKRPNTITLGNAGTLASQGVKDGMEVTYKDLGPQIGYRTVFLIEYAGPIAFLLLYAMRPALIYGSDAASKPFCYAQKVFIALFAAHFIKRELETLFVHKFSRPTMPFRNVFKNSIYYWSFAAFIGYVLCSPDYTAPASDTQVNVGAAAMIVNELLNFAVHFQLSRMRRGDGDEARSIPGGPLFALVSCPNYFFEVMSWVSFSFGTNIVSSWLFTAAGLLQMAEWAVKKHRGYIKQDPSIKKKRKAIIPFLL